jgi:hypothetical protein
MIINGKHLSRYQPWMYYIYKKYVFDVMKTHYFISPAIFSHLYRLVDSLLALYLYVLTISVFLPVGGIIAIYICVLEAGNILFPRAKIGCER